MADLTPEQIEEYVELYFDVDVDDSGSISRREFREFLEREGKSKSEIQALTDRFDLNNTGLISFNEWCTVLGLNQKETKRVEHTLDEDITQLAADMSSSNKKKIVSMYKDVVEKNGELKDVAKVLKANLDKRFQRLWHVVIIKGQYWAYYSHEPKHSFVFRHGANIVLVWRTPIL